MNLAGVRTLFELEERLGKRILEALYDEGTREQHAEPSQAGQTGRTAGRAAPPEPLPDDGSERPA